MVMNFFIGRTNNNEAALPDVRSIFDSVTTEKEVNLHQSVNFVNQSQTQGDQLDCINELENDDVFSDNSKNDESKPPVTKQVILSDVTKSVSESMSSESTTQVQPNDQPKSPPRKTIFTFFESR